MMCGGERQRMGVDREGTGFTGPQKMVGKLHNLLRPPHFCLGIA